MLSRDMRIVVGAIARAIKQTLNSLSARRADTPDIPVPVPACNRRWPNFNGAVLWRFARDACATVPHPATHPRPERVIARAGGKGKTREIPAGPARSTLVSWKCGTSLTPPPEQGQKRAGRKTTILPPRNGIRTGQNKRCNFR